VALERQELWCHSCQNYVQFSVDVELDGNHVLECPKCGHEHCRVVKKGEITDIRWDSRNGPTTHATNVSYSAVSIWVTSTSTSSYFLHRAWANTST